ncbi:hypothetical protein PILCRDRAFT_431704 [Piloderma croceum F 1598]|uniref:Uncharacterized protein n=1 Tax=Piloderma croceum (strain F 1598) TaxID=765440 RepID=A0A0C3FVW6_PILCF|nr:hypothetical protein PILCRDRAFT_431704 [Piloderma croceum F 1598]
MHDRLLAAWDARDDDHKFQLVCMAHNQGDQNWHRYITPWARRNAIRILAISEHVSNAFWKEFKYVSASVDPVLRSAGYELVLVDAHIPILNLSELPDKSGRKVLSSAVIQGSFDPVRRAYFDIFKDLIRNLHGWFPLRRYIVLTFKSYLDSPASWGYLLLDNGISYIPDTSILDPPFKLYLGGIVTPHVDLNCSEYYDVMAEMDLCIPALGLSDLYYKPVQRLPCVWRTQYSQHDVSERCIPMLMMIGCPQPTQRS